MYIEGGGILPLWPADFFAGMGSPALALAAESMVTQRNGTWTTISACEGRCGTNSTGTCSEVNGRWQTHKQSGWFNLCWLVCGDRFGRTVHAREYNCNTDTTTHHQEPHGLFVAPRVFVCRNCRRWRTARAFVGLQSVIDAFGSQNRHQLPTPRITHPLFQPRTLEIVSFRSSQTLTQQFVISKSRSFVATY